MGPVLAVGTAITVARRPDAAARAARDPRRARVLARQAARRESRVWASIGRRRADAARRDHPRRRRAARASARSGALEDRPPLSFADSFRERAGVRHRPGADRRPLQARPARPGRGDRRLRATRAPSSTSSRGRPACCAAGATALSTRPRADADRDHPDRATRSRRPARTPCPALRDALRGLADGRAAACSAAPAAEAYDARDGAGRRREADRPARPDPRARDRRRCWCARSSPRCTSSRRSCCPTRSRSARARCCSRTCSASPASDPALPTFAFVFLVALGVDYNVFLISRIREEREHRDARDAVISGLERSGGVITSAGLILAGTFLALVAVDMVSLAQVGFTVALGLLVDTFLVRCFLVPAIAVKLGDRSWWPLPPAAQVAVGRVGRARRRVRPQRPAPRPRRSPSRASPTAAPARCARRSRPPRPTPEADEIDVRATGTINLALAAAGPALRADGRRPRRRAPAGAARRRRAVPAADRRPGRRRRGERPHAHRRLRQRALEPARRRRAQPRAARAQRHGRRRQRGRRPARRGRRAAAIANDGTLELARLARPRQRARARARAAPAAAACTTSARCSWTRPRSRPTRARPASITPPGSRPCAARPSPPTPATASTTTSPTWSWNTRPWPATPRRSPRSAATTEVRGATLSGPGVNLAGLQVDIPSWMSVEHTTLTGGAPNCHLTAQVEVRSWVGNRADDSSCPAGAPAPVVVDPAPGLPLAAVAPEPVSTAPVATSHATGARAAAHQAQRHQAARHRPVRRHAAADGRGGAHGLASRSCGGRADTEGPDRAPHGARSTDVPARRGRGPGTPVDDSPEVQTMGEGS